MDIGCGCKPYKKLCKNVNEYVGLELIFQLLNAYIYQITLTKYIYLNLLTTLIFIAPINIVGLILSKLLPKNNDLYLDNIVLAKKFKDV